MMNHTRISREESYLAKLEILENRSTCIRGHVGALIIRDKRVISEGYNGAPPNMIDCYEAGECLTDYRTLAKMAGYIAIEGCARTIHAEANAIAFAARHGIATEGAEMWCTYSPCRECAKLIVSAGIVRFVYVKEYRLGAIELLDDAGIEVVKFGSGF
jgi:dCMP deaminase